jgi:hypothetical protein
VVFELKKEKAHLSEKKKAELQLIAELTLEATLAAEEKLSKLAAKTKATH